MGLVMGGSQESGGTLRVRDAGASQEGAAKRRCGKGLRDPLIRCFSNLSEHQPPGGPRVSRGTREVALLASSRVMRPPPVPDHTLGTTHVSQPAPFWRLASVAQLHLSEQLPARRGVGGAAVVSTEGC